MRNETLTLLAFSALGFACGKAPPPAAADRPAATPVQAEQAAALRGTIVETIDAKQYTYLKLKTAGGEVWAAVPTTDRKAGAEVALASPIWMENFKSSTMNRTWERIAFGTLAEAPARAAPALPPGHPMVSAPAEVDEVKVAKASGQQGRTIADLYARKDELKDKRVSVRGKVVKATNGVMGKNWLHLRDGTGEGASSDLAVASKDTARVGDTVVVSGKVHLDRDLGAGYRYDVLVEDAQVMTE